MAWWAARLRVVRTESAGFTLVEVVASLLVFAVASLAVAELLGSALNVSRKNTQRVQAAQVAAQAIETARDSVKNSFSIPNDSTQQVVVGSTTFTVATHASWTNVGAADSSCTGAVPGEVAYRRIAATVTWPRMSGSPPVSTTTIATPLNPNTITIPVQLVGATRTPIPNQTITLTPPSGAPQSAVTDSNGCVVFAQLTPETYTVGVNTPGYVDTTSNAVTNHTETAGQSVPGMTGLVTIFYDHPATLALSPSFSSGFTSATYPLPTSGMTDTLQQTGWPDGSTQAYAAPGGVLTRTVFPFAMAPGSGYSAFAGSCAANAATVSTALGTPSPGGSAALALPVVSRVYTISVSGTAQGGLTLQASNSPDGCTTTYTLPGTTSTVTSTKGQIKFSLPAGHYIFTTVVSGRTRTSSTISVLTSSSTTSTVNLT